MMSFEEILKKRQKDLKQALKNELQSMNYMPVSQNGFLYAPGTVPVLLVAHLYTVHQRLPNIICYSKDGRYAMSPQGIGGDDRAGVCMILQIINRAPCHVLFCEDEETGGKGARAFIRSNRMPGVNYIVEMDRKGNNDAVFYSCDNPEFTKYVCGFGFSEAFGSFSDISVIAPHLGVAAVNISAGYFNEHSLHEVIDLQAMQNNAERVLRMVQTETKVFPYVERRRSESLCGLPDGQRSLFDFTREDDADERSELLMPIPDTARLIVNGHEIAPLYPYLIDQDGNVYAYLQELNAAIESESSYAFDSNGEPVSFSTFDAQRIQVLSIEALMERLNG